MKATIFRGFLFNKMGKCKIDGCQGYGQLKKNGDRTFLRGYCQNHYKKYLKGELLVNYRIGKTKDSRYESYRSMIRRCLDSSQISYTSYGKKGITVCDEWIGIDGFNNFCRDMPERPSLTHTLDRINNNLGYSKENCRWATWHEQNANRSNNSKIIGVSVNKRGIYIASLMVNRILYQKSFKTIEQAIEHRKELELKYL